MRNNRLGLILAVPALSGLLAAGLQSPAVASTQTQSTAALEEGITMVDSLSGTVVYPIDATGVEEVVSSVVGSGDLADFEGATILESLPEEAATALVPEASMPHALASRSDGTMQPQVVVGADGRVQMNSRESPYIQQPLLLSQKNDGLTYRCSGALVGQRTIVTAAHCLYDGDKGGWVTGTMAFFGVENGAAYASCTVGYRTVPQTWALGGEPSTHDWGVMQLNCNAQDYLGSMGYRNPGTGSVSGSNWNVSGYPGDKPNMTLWQATGSLQSLNATQFRYTIDTAGGQSGGPIWRLEPGTACGNCVIGVHTRGWSTADNVGLYNDGTRLIESFKTVVDNMVAS